MLYIKYAVCFEVYYDLFNFKVITFSYILNIHLHSSAFILYYVSLIRHNKKAIVDKVRGRSTVSWNTIIVNLLKFYGFLTS